jgi:hypothetical protein
VKVFHHHGRERGSKEADDTVVGYEIGRGAYYGSLLVDGRNEAWKLWLATTHTGRPPAPSVLQRLERKGDTPGVEPPPVEDAEQPSAEMPSPNQAQRAKA